MATIGVVTTSFPRWPGDPAGSFVLGLAQALTRRGHCLQVVAPEPDTPIETEWTKDPEWLGQVQVWPAPYARPRHLQQLFFRAGVPDNLTSAPWLAALVPLAVAGLARKARQLAPHWDAVLSHWLLPSALVAGWTRQRGTTHLAVAHSADVHLLSRLAGASLFASLVLGCTDRIGFVSNQLRREFLALVPGEHQARARQRSVEVAFGVDQAALETTRPVNQLRQELGLNRFTLLTISRLVPIKGIDLLLQALARCPDVQLVVAGAGPERAALEHGAARLGVEARFVGQVGPLRRAELFAACDAVAIPSRTLASGRHEGLPLVLIEALAAGKPVIVSRTGAAAEIVEHDVNGLLVPEADSESLARQVARLRDNPALVQRLAAAAERTGRARSWQSLASRWEELLLASGTCGRPGSLLSSC